MAIKGCIIGLTFFLLTSCASTDVETLPPFSFIWKHQTVDSDYSKVYARILSGLKCSSFSADNQVFFDKKISLFDVYDTNVFRTRTSHIGIIEVRRQNDSLTLVSVGAGDSQKGGEYRELWLRWAEGVGKGGILCIYIHFSICMATSSPQVA